MADGNWKPLFVMLIILFTIGIVFNVVLSGFLDVSVINPDITGTTSGNLLNALYSQVQSPLADCVDIGFSLFGLNVCMPTLNPLALSSGIQDFIGNQVIIASYIPLWLLAPFIVLFIIAFIWTSIKLFLP